MLNFEKIRDDYNSSLGIEWEAQVRIAFHHGDVLSPELQALSSAIREKMPVVHNEVMDNDTANGQYNPVKDLITMRHPTKYFGPMHELNILLHEAAHATGHSTRLNRREVMMPGFFRGWPELCSEEMTAELASLLIFEKLGRLSRDHYLSSIAYLQMYTNPFVDLQLVWQNANQAAEWLMALYSSTTARKEAA